MTHELIVVGGSVGKGERHHGDWIGELWESVVSRACSQRIEAVRHLMWAYQFATSTPRLVGNPRLDLSIP